jgi:hypothetical protein
MRRRLCLALVVAHGLYVNAPAAAQAGAAEAGDRARTEARTRYDRGLALFEREHDPAAALAELRRAYELVPMPRTLFALGLVYAAMNRPVDALVALEEVVRAPGDLTPAQRQLAVERRDEQKQRVGFVRLDCEVAAAVQVDSVPRGPLRTGEALPVAAGLRVITVEAPGFLPFRKEVLVAGTATVSVGVKLVPAGVPRPLRIVTNVPDAAIVVDGKEVGRAPLDGPIPLDPGPHVVEVHRACYVASSRALEIPRVGAPSPTEIDLRLSPVAATASCPRGRLVLVPSEERVEVTVDEEALPSGALAPDLPAGRHQVRVSRAGFSAVEGTLDVAAGVTAAWAVTLAPNAETRASYEDRAHTQRRWAQGLMAAGGAVALAGGIATVVTWRAVNHARAERDRVLQTCDPYGRLTDVPACTDALASAANDDVHRKELARGLSLGALAAGLVATAVGAALAYAGQDPTRYEHAPPPGFRRTDANGEVRSRLSFTAQAALAGDAGARGFEAGLRLTF